MMKKKIICVIISLLLMPYTCLAETIYLKNGNKVQGQILEKSDKQIKIDVSGITLTYYMDEIEKIEGVLEAVSPSEVKPPEIERKKLPSSFDYDPALSSMDKRELILSLMKASGTMDNLKTTISQIISRSSGQEAAQFRELFQIDEIVEQVVPVYDKYFTEDELRELVAFYKSQLGKKLLMVTPMILEDIMQASLQYFEGKLQEIQTPIE